MAKLDDARKRSFVLSERIRRRTDMRLQKRIAQFKPELSFLPLDDLIISVDAWDHVTSSDIDPEKVFAHPEMLRVYPETSEYYRGIALLSRKRVASLAGSVDSWENMDYRNSVAATEKIKKVARLYNTVISSIIEGATDWTLQNGYRNIIANMGIGLDGSIRNLIGQDAENIVKERILHWLDTRGLVTSRSEQGRDFDLPKNYSMHYGSEPDIEFRETVNGKQTTIATIEIKGGTDPAGALERLGAVQKSFKETPPNSKNILVVGVVTDEMKNRLEGLGIGKYFLLDDVSQDGDGWLDFLNEVFHFTVRITNTMIE